MKTVTLRFQTDPKSVQKDARKPQCSRTRCGAPFSEFQIWKFLNTRGKNQNLGTAG